MRNAQSVHDETYVKFVKGLDHKSTYYSAEAEAEKLSPTNVNTNIFAMLSRLLFEVFIDPLKFFLSSYKRISVRDLLWIPLFLLVMSASRFGDLMLLSIRFLLKPEGFRTRFKYSLKRARRK